MLIKIILYNRRSNNSHIVSAVSNQTIVKFKLVQMVKCTILSSIWNVSIIMSQGSNSTSYCKIKKQNLIYTFFTTYQGKGKHKNTFTYECTN